MGIDINIIGSPRKRSLLLRPSGQQILKEVEKHFLSQAKGLQQQLTKTTLHDKSLSVVLHPAEEAVWFEFDNDGNIACSARTSNAGPGFHDFVVNLLEGCGRSVGISWTWDDPSKNVSDEAGYHGSHDYEMLQQTMAGWLQGLCKSMSGRDGGLALCMPADHPIVVGDHYAVSQLGYWSREWFSEVASASGDEMAKFAMQFFPWWNRGQDALFWLKTALVLMWIGCPWHQPRSQEEKEQYRLIIACLEEAYRLDDSLTFPWAEWKQLLELSDDQMRLKQIQKSMPAEIPEPTIGFSRRSMRRFLIGDWRITLPGYYYCDDEEEGRTIVYWFGDKAVRGSHFKFTGEDGKPSSAAEILPKRDKGSAKEFVELQNGRVIGWARIELTEEDGSTFWMLQGAAAIDGEVTIVTISFLNIDDKQWAIDTFRSLYR